MDHPKRPYDHNNVFTFKHGWQGSVFGESQLCPSVEDPHGYEQFDLGIVEINDMGDFKYGSQLDTICQRIRDVRQHNSSGAIVVCFIHGWHNNADWDNANLASFRRLLKALMCRETEFLQRRVIGVYLGWNGNPTDGVGSCLSRIPLVKHITFRNRYSAARDVGQGDALSCSLVHLTAACKEAISEKAIPEAPLIMIGHSMGAFILQSAFRELLKNTDSPLVKSAVSGNTPVTISNNKLSAVTMPDLLLSLNSAAESEVAKDIIAMMEQDGWKKRFEPSSAEISVAPYDPPLLISATSSKDSDTNFLWRVGHFFEKPSTDGHDPKLATHTFVKSPAPVDCAAASTIDFGQPWHCLHKVITPDPTPWFRIDIPHDRSIGKTLTHTAYDLIPKHPANASPFWLFQIPGEIVADHSDIFNYQAASFVLALIQVSAVLASAGSGWEKNFSEISLG